MKTTIAHCVAGLSLFASCSTAVPLFRPAKNPVARAPQPQSYSVVPVDGGSSSPATPATKTVTDAITLFQTATILSTIIAAPTDAPPATTIISQIVTYATTVTPSLQTVTMQPAVTSVPYDDGQWHTTYYFKSTMSPAADANAVASITSAPTPAAQSSSPAAPTSVDLGQWAPWSGKNNGLFEPPS